MFFKISLLKYCLLFFLGLIALHLPAQDLKIELGENRLPITEYFTISVKLQNASIKTISDFPEIEGFQKSSRPRSRSRITVAGKTTVEETITQNYAALKEGTYTLKPFTIKVNGKEITSKGTSITIQTELLTDEPVNPPPKESPALITGKTPGKGKSESFLTLETSKGRVYVGEGLQVQLFFYLSAAEQGLLDFYNFGEQMPALIKNIKPHNVWEEESANAEIKTDTILVKGKSYIRFKLYESVYYPLSAEFIRFPALALTMLQRPKDQTYNLAPTQQELVPFVSNFKNVAVEALAPHPLREIIPVGQFQLREGANSTVVRVNKSFTYFFEVTGSGNLTAINLPDTLSAPGLEIYPPQTEQFRNTINPRAGRKTFRYTLLARKPGKYNLSHSFYLPFFNPVTERYDTLRSALTVQVSGAPEPEKSLKPEEADSFYRLIQSADNDLQNINQIQEIKLYTNLVILLLICATLYIFFKK
ncbi:MAG: hypothetical protein COW65_14770 [Cytophagales bacterium CG18_big_fil_WC_8_21_14_2_50_42_9]|nr:MAG: hypothetical protein COW65_14770 [Cytophagales bacterium CG18_big_fil_WC_8_21_14_2_50_42_9]